MLEQWQRDVFWDPLRLLRHAVRRLLEVQWQAVSTTRGDEAVLYAWSGCGFNYFGFASMQRQTNNKPGVPQRWLEHMILVRRRHMHGSDFGRYRLARRSPARSLSFLAARVGQCAAMQAAKS